MIEAARELSREPHTYWTDQLNNHDSIAGYYPLGEEIWSQTNGEVDAFVHCVGTAASSRGVATVLKRHKPGVRIVVVEPAESSVLLGGAAGAAQDRRRRDRLHAAALGAGARGRDRAGQDGRREGRWRRRLAREEGLFAGTSSGANVVAAIQVAERLGPGATVVTLMADSGLKYLSTDVYRARRPAEAAHQG